RNLAVRVELQLCQSGVDPRISMRESVQAIFIHQSGPAFLTECFTQTTYHSKTPQTGEGIKVLLPDQLSERHHLLFTVFHVHVKRKTGG
ncbi:unnamed protein product, partial [Discosporangium mesarthrocarpum]